MEILALPNWVLSEGNHLKGLIDWTELGIGDIHNELRPVFSVLGEEAFQSMIEIIEPKLGSINQDIVRTSAVVHELAVLVSGKQKGELTPERENLAINSVRLWLDRDS